MYNITKGNIEAEYTNLTPYSPKTKKNKFLPQNYHKTFLNDFKKFIDGIERSSDALNRSQLEILNSILGDYIRKTDKISNKDETYIKLLEKVALLKKSVKKALNDLPDDNVDDATANSAKRIIDIRDKEITRKFIQEVYEAYERNIKENPPKKKLFSRNHHKILLNDLKKLLNVIPPSRNEIYKSELKDLESILDEYIHKTDKTHTDLLSSVILLKECVGEKLRAYKLENEYNVGASKKDEIVDVRDKKIKYRLFNRKIPIKKPLFPHKSGKPHINDIKQGFAGDCYLLAALMSIVRTKPELIIKCFPDYPKDLNNEKAIDRFDEDFNQDHKVKVRFFKTKQDFNLPGYRADGTVTIIVDKTVFQRGRAPWVRILEKAYAVYRFKGYDASYARSDGKYSSIKTLRSDIIDAGLMTIATVAVTGKPCRLIRNDQDKKSKKFRDSYLKKNNEIFNEIKKALDDGKFVTVAAYRPKGKTAPYAKGLYFNHAYAVIKAEEESGGTKYITVANPHREEIRAYTKQHKSVSFTPRNNDRKGISRLELNDFCNYFSDVSISSTP